jgi:HSP20 family protein
MKPSNQGDTIMLVRRNNNNIDRIFEDWTRALNNNNGFALALDVHETADAYTINADVPGVNGENIDIRLQDDVLTISAENSYENQEERGNALLKERRYGKFSRSLRFPVHVKSDAVEANFDNGVLTVTVPKAEEVKARRIEVKAR